MANLVDTTKSFYQNNKLVSLINATQTRTFILTSDHLLAEQNVEDTTSSSLFAVDDKKSVLRIHSVGGAKIRNYAAYGHAEIPQSRLHSPGFNGELHSPVTRGYILGAGYRLLNTTLMRFTAPDNLSPFGLGGHNSYLYCNSDPINNIDPSGHITVAKALMKKGYNVAKKIDNSISLKMAVSTYEASREANISARGSQHENRRDLLNNPYINRSRKQLLRMRAGLRKAIKKTDTLWVTPDEITNNLDAIKYLQMENGLINQALSNARNQGFMIFESSKEAYHHYMYKMKVYQFKSDITDPSAALPAAQEIRRHSV